MTNKTVKAGSKVYVCSTAQNANILQAAYEGLTWVQVGSVGSIGDFGATSTDVTYNTLDETVTNHQKGIATAGSPNLEVASIYDDAGQIILRTFGDPLNQNNMAIKIERNDAPVGYSNTIFYSRGIVTGPNYIGGRRDDFDLESFTLQLNQIPIRVNPADLP